MSEQSSGSWLHSLLRAAASQWLKQMEGQKPSHFHLTQDSSTWKPLLEAPLGVQRLGIKSALWFHTEQLHLQEVMAMLIKHGIPTLTGWLSWSESHPVHQKFVGLIPSQVIHPLLVWPPVWAHTIPCIGMYGRQSIDVSCLHQCFSLSFSSSLSKSNEKMPLVEDK